MVVILDTNIIVDYLRDKGNTVSKVELFPEICLPTIVCGELLFGAAISGNPVKHKEKVTEFIRRSQVLAVEFWK